MLFAAVLVVGLFQFTFASATDDGYQPVPTNPETQAFYIESLINNEGKLELTADHIEWYEGEEANEVFREREQDSEMTEAPSGYYIVNDSDDLQTYEVADDAVVLMQIWNRTGNMDEADTVWNEEISLEKFIELVNSDEDEGFIKDFPYHISIKDGKITKIVQQFIP
ncbi:hypothetical protein EBB07_03255 [Paenibacillaceae bacterium]|nr:hypothetical protein EBB07_03255 [Paenibacillaceae bacterium]